MKIMINFNNTELYKEIYIEDYVPLENLKYIIEAEFEIPYLDQELKFEGKILDNDLITLQDYKIKENDVLIISKKHKLPQAHIPNNIGSLFDNAMKKINTQSSQDSRGSQNISSNTNGTNNSTDITKIFDSTMQMIKNNPSTANKNLFPNLMSGYNSVLDQRVKSEVSKMKEYYLTNPDELNYLFHKDSQMAELIVSNDEKGLEGIIKKRIMDIEKEKRKEQEEYLHLMNADPNDPEAQKKIEEYIRLQNIEENRKMAIEYIPETLTQVHMLFINIEINKKKIVALVDTGAQTTIISEELAKQCGIYNLCDTRYAGIAKGVGTSKILGVIHAAHLKIGDR